MNHHFLVCRLMARSSREVSNLIFNVRAVIREPELPIHSTNLVVKRVQSLNLGQLVVFVV